MSDLIGLLTTFTGRISRRQWWVGFVIVLVGSLIGTLLLNPEQLTAEKIPPPSWPDTIWQLVLFIPGTAITVKRFNDRDWPWWLGYATALISLLLYLPAHFGMPIDPEVGGLGTFVFWGVLAILLLVLIDNGFLRGTSGPNRYGPAPLAKSEQPA